jgi:hypothetical protein
LGLNSWINPPPPPHPPSQHLFLASNFLNLASLRKEQKKYCKFNENVNNKMLQKSQD